MPIKASIPDVLRAHSATHGFNHDSNEIRPRRLSLLSIIRRGFIITLHQCHRKWKDQPSPKQSFPLKQTYCGEDSDVGRAVKELEQYFRDRLKLDYQSPIALFRTFTEDDFNQKHSGLLTDFIARLHAKEVLAGPIREILAEIIFNVDLQQPTASDAPRMIKKNWIVHCRCGSTYDEVPLVQCYACQLWQHVSCVVIHDSFRPYYCFECHHTCEADPSSCLKTNIRIAKDNQSSY